MIFQALRIPLYRSFIYAQILSQLGDTGYRFMFTTFTTQILCTNGFKFSSNTFLVNTLAYCILAPYGGFLADRWNKKNIMIFCSFAKILLLFFSMWFGNSGYLSSTDSLLVLTVLSSTIDVFFFFLASQATLSHLVPKKYLFQANSFNQIIQTLLPTLGLGLMFFYTQKIHQKTENPFQYSHFIGILTGLLYLGSVYFFKKLPNLNVDSKPPKVSFIRETIKGFKILSSQNIFIYIFMINVFLLISQICLNSIINYLSRGSAIHSISIKSYCIILNSLGGVIGAMILSVLNIQLLGYAFAFGTFIGSLGFCYLFFDHSFFELVFPFLVGMITSFITIPFRTYLQQNISVEYQGRSFSIMESLAYGAAGIAAFFIKMGINQYGVSLFILSMFIIYFIGFLLCFFSKTMREINLNINQDSSEFINNSYIH